MEFEGVMLTCAVYCNGIEVGRHEGGYTPFKIDITSAVRFEAQNVLVVKVDSSEQSGVPPFGNVVDYLTYGGIYHEVWMYAADPIRLERLWLDCPNVLSDRKALNCGCEITAEIPSEGVLEITLFSLKEKL